MILTIAWILASILALYGALAAWLTFGRGPFRFTYNRFVAWLLEKIGKDAITIGARAYVRKPEMLKEFGPNGTEPTHLPYDHPIRKWWRHEKQHNRQWRVRPLMAPVYLVWGLAVGYEGNPLEIEAEREEGP